MQWLPSFSLPLSHVKKFSFKSASHFLKFLQMKIPCASAHSHAALVLVFPFKLTWCFPIASSFILQPNLLTNGNHTSPLCSMPLEVINWIELRCRQRRWIKWKRLQGGWWRRQGSVWSVSMPVRSSSQEVGFWKGVVDKSHHRMYIDENWVRFWIIKRQFFAICNQANRHETMCNIFSVLHRRSARK